MRKHSLSLTVLAFAMCTALPAQAWSPSPANCPAGTKPSSDGTCLVIDNGYSHFGSGGTSTIISSAPKNVYHSHPHSHSSSSHGGNFIVGGTTRNTFIGSGLGSSVLRTGVSSSPRIISVRPSAPRVTRLSVAPAPRFRSGGATASASASAGNGFASASSRARSNGGFVRGSGFGSGGFPVGSAGSAGANAGAFAFSGPGGSFAVAGATAMNGTGLSGSLPASLSNGAVLSGNTTFVPFTFSGANAFAGSGFGGANAGAISLTGLGGGQVLTPISCGGLGANPLGRPILGCYALVRAATGFNSAALSQARRTIFLRYALAGGTGYNYVAGPAGFYGYGYSYGYGYGGGVYGGFGGTGGCGGVVASRYGDAWPRRGGCGKW